MKIFLSVIGILGLSFFSGKAKSDQLAPLFLQKFSETTKNNQLFQSAYEIAGQLDNSDGPKDSIEKIERILQRKNFAPMAESQVKERSQFHLLLPLGVSSWRQAAQLILADAYFQKGDLDTSSKIVSSIIKADQLELALYLQMLIALEKDQVEQLKKTGKVVASIESPRFPKFQKLFLALSHSKNKEYRLAWKTAESVAFDRSELEKLRKLIIAESRFNHFLETVNELSFEDKIRSLSKIQTVLEDVKSLDHRAAYLKAEVLWNIASAFRLKDPVANEQKIKKFLKLADNTITPFVERAIRDRQPVLSEEAFFFSIAVRWEAREEKSAIRRLKALPELYPLGIYRADSYQLLGDYYFERDEFELALENYVKLSEIGDPSKAAYAMYKSGWAFYNLEKKWSALRHFERLYQYYLENQNTEGKAAALKKEGRQDFLFVLSEVMKPLEAIEEIQYLSLAPEEELSDIDTLGLFYQKAGMFENSLIVWSYLFDKHGKHERSADWFKRSLEDLLASGKRSEVADFVATFLPRWKRLNSDSAKEASMIEKWEEVMLSIHREGRRSEDEKILAATDENYKLYWEIVPQAQGTGKVYFYGAQRMEKKDRAWSALKWYKRAHLDESYELYSEAILNYVRILYSIADELSIADNNQQKTKQDYAKLAQFAGWFFEKRRDHSKIKLVTNTMIEALFKSGQKEKIFNLLSSNDWEKSPNLYWDIYKQHKAQVYDEELYAYGFNLALSILKNQKLSKEQIKDLKTIAQELSFSQGFRLSQSKNFSEARDFYTLSLRFPVDKNLSLKAHHNRIIDHKRWGQEFRSDYEEFLNSKKRYSAQAYEQRELLVNLHTRAYKNYKEALYLESAANASFEVFKILEDHDKKMEALWESMLLLGRTHRSERVLELYQSAAEQGKKLTAEQSQLVVRLLMSSGARKEALQLFSNSNASLGESVATTLLDFYSLQEQDLLSTDQLNELVQNNKERILKQDALIPMWSAFAKEDIVSSEQGTRMPASPDKALLDRAEGIQWYLKKIAAELDEMQKRKSQLSSFLKSNIPAEVTKASCLAPEITNETIRALTSIRENPVQVEVWPQFLEKLEEKTEELRGIASEELDECVSVRRQLGWFILSPEQKASVCKKIMNCLNSGIASPEEVRELLTSEDYQKASATDRFLALLDSGAIVEADYLADSIQSTNEKLWMLAQIRLFHLDLFHAYQLLNQSGKKKEAKQLQRLVWQQLGVDS